MIQQKRKKTVDVIAGIIEKDGKILIAKRKAGVNSQSKWEFPGGKLQEGEKHEECLKREIKEELNLEINVIGWISSRTYKLTEDTDINLHAYYAQYVSGELKLEDHVDAKWVKKENLLNYEFLEPDKQIVKDVLERWP